MLLVPLVQVTLRSVPAVCRVKVSCKLQVHFKVVSLHAMRERLLQMVFAWYVPSPALPASAAPLTALPAQLVSSYLITHVSTHALESSTAMFVVSAVLQEITMFLSLLVLLVPQPALLALAQLQTVHLVLQGYLLTTMEPASQLALLTPLVFKVSALVAPSHVTVALNSQPTVSTVLLAMFDQDQFAREVVEMVNIWLMDHAGVVIPLVLPVPQVLLVLPAPILLPLSRMESAIYAQEIALSAHLPLLSALPALQVSSYSNQHVFLHVHPDPTPSMELVSVKMDLL